MFVHRVIRYVCYNLKPISHKFTRHPGRVIINELVCNFAGLVLCRGSIAHLLNERPLPRRAGLGRSRGLLLVVSAVAALGVAAGAVCAVGVAVGGELILVPRSGWRLWRIGL